MSLESQQQDRKSLRLVDGAQSDIPAIAADCVCFANANGGALLRTNGVKLTKNVSDEKSLKR